MTMLLALLCAAPAADTPRPPVADAALLEAPVATALVGDDWGEVPSEALPADPPAITASAASIAHGQTVTFTATTPGPAPVVFLFADVQDDPVCPAPLGTCVGVTGGWLAFGPYTVREGQAELELELPPGFHGDVLEAQAAVWSAQGVRLSPVITLPVVDALPPEAAEAQASTSTGADPS